MTHYTGYSTDRAATPIGKQLVAERVPGIAKRGAPGSFENLLTKLKQCILLVRYLKD
jgi:hypothetical protein